MSYQISITICEELTDEEFDSAYYALCEFLNETIGDDWKAMIKAWLREKQTNNRWAAERKDKNDSCQSV